MPLHNGPPLVNGRGPLDGFLSRRSSAVSNENMVVDLTEDNSSSPVKCLVTPASVSPCLPTKGKHQGKDKTVSLEKLSKVDCTYETNTDCIVVSDEVEEVQEIDGNQTASISQLDSTQESDSEQEEQDESGNVSSLGKSMLSVSSVSSMSESSPEKSKTEDPTPTTTPTVCTTHTALY